MTPFLSKYFDQLSPNKSDEGYFELNEEITIFRKTGCLVINIYSEFL